MADAYEIYRVALETRNLEINLFWQRSNYFLALNTALAIGFFNIKNGEYQLLLALVGGVVSGLWFGVNLGSKYWQSRWEQRLSIVETDVAPNLDFFAAPRETRDSDVRRSLENNDHGLFHRIIDQCVLGKPSVSYLMTILSLVFLFTWGILEGARLEELFHIWR